MNQVVRSQSASTFLPEERLLVLAARILLNAEDAAGMESALRCCLDWTKVLKHSLTLGIQPLLYKHLSEDRFAGYVPSEVLLHLKESYWAQSIRGLRIYGQIGQIIDAIGSSNVPIVLLKGAFLAQWVYGDIALRPMSDIDILCRKADEQLIRSTLIGLGYYQEKSIYHSSFHEAVHNVGCHHLQPFRKIGAHTVEVHTQLFPDDYDHPLEMDRVWETVTDCNFNTLKIKCFALDYLLLYLSLHLYHHMASGLVTLYWFCDIHEVIRRYQDQFDWDQLRAKAHSLGAADQMEVVFQLLKSHWNTPFPEKAFHSPFAPRFCLASILKNQLYEKRDEIKLLSDCVREVRFVFRMKGWAKRLHYLWGLIFPVPAHLMHRYGLKSPLAVGLCYFLLPLIRFKHLMRGLFFMALFRFRHK